MNEYALFQLGHLLLFVYWLGGDLGTFWSSRFISRTDLSVPARATAAKIMAGVDQVPRVCMTLIVPFGLQMAVMRTMVRVDDWVVWAVWLVSFAWLAMVLVLHFRHDRPYIALLTRIDFGFRVLVIIAFLAAGSYGLATGELIVLDWIAVKIIVFGLLVACGLMIRVNLKPFEPAFHRLLTEGSDPETERAISGSLRRCLPYVYAIWVGLLICAALSLGVVRL